MLGWDLDRPHVIVVVDLPFGLSRQSGARVLQHVLSLTESGVPAVVPRAHGAAALVPRTDRASLLDLGRAILRHLEDSSGVAVGAGTPCHPLRDATRSYREACTAALVARARGLREAMCFEDAGVFRFLYNQPSGDLRAFCDEQIGALGENLVETLQAYFACGTNVRRVAARLHTHYNTVAQRLRRIEALTGKDLHDADTCLSLQVALAIRNLRS